MESKPKNESNREVSKEPVVVTLGTLSDVGKVRSVNEDSFYALAKPDSPHGIDAFLVVADGMGGREAGDVASSMAIAGVSDRIVGDKAAFGVEDQGLSLSEVFQDVNASIYEASAQPGKHGMGTTLTLAILSGGNLTFAHVGDSRAYLFRDGELRQVTSDHSWVAEEVARGVLTPEQAKHDPRRSILTRAIGVAPEVQVDEFAVEVEENDLLILCSDGLHSQIDDDEIRDVLAEESPQQACQTLVERANAMGGQDNVTVVIAQINSVGERQEKSSTPKAEAQPTEETASISQDTAKHSSEKKRESNLFSHLGSAIAKLLKSILR